MIRRIENVGKLSIAEMWLAAQSNAMDDMIVMVQTPF